MPLAPRSWALLLVLATASLGRADDLAGRYTLQGERRATHGASETVWGDATIEAEGSDLVLARSDGDTTVRGVLRPVPGGYLFEAPLLAGRGMVGVLEGAEGAQRVFSARYQRGPRGLRGRYRILADGAAVALGREVLLAASRPAVRVAVSVDWEGRDLEEANLRAIERLREALPGVPLTHFLNAAYLTKPQAQAEEVAAKIRRALRPGDETGLHVHAWRSLVERSGVAYRRSPTFWNQPPRRVSTSLGPDEGHDVMLGAYSPMELRAIVGTSRRLLEEAAFPLSRSFRAGGWLAGPAVLEAIRAEGFHVDSSATDCAWHEELSGSPLRDRMRELWPGVTEERQPFTIETSAGEVLEMPDTCALADYVTAEEMVAHVDRAVRRFRADPRRDVFVHVGFHLETADRYAERVTAAIQQLRAEHGARVVFETLEASAARAREGFAAAASAEAAAGLPLPDMALDEVGE